MYKEKETKNLSKFLNAKYYNYAPYKYLCAFQMHTKTNVQRKRKKNIYPKF